MKRKPLDQNEFLSALDFVRTDIDNLRAYFEQGAIDSTPAVMERALKLRVSIEMFVALFKANVGGDVAFSDVLETISAQSKIMTKQNAEVLEELKKGKEPIQATILNEVLNVKEMLLKQGLSQPNSYGSEIAQLKSQLASSLSDLEERIMKNVEYSQQRQQRQLSEYSQRMISEFSCMQKPSAQGGVVGEILGEIAEFKEECAKQIASVEKNILENLELAKDEIVYSQKSDEILMGVKDVGADVAQSIVLAKTSMQVLRGISKQLLGIYESQKRSLADIQKSIDGVSHGVGGANGEDLELAQGFAELKEELQSISSIINFEELDKIKDTNQAIQIVDSYTNAQFEPEGLLQTAKDLEALATELSELEKSQAERVQSHEKLQEEISEEIADEETCELSDLDNYEEDTADLDKLDSVEDLEELEDEEDEEEETL